MYRLLCTLLVVGQTLAMDNLRVAFQWKKLDYDYETEQDRQDALQNQDFIPENNLPLGLEVYNDRLFITVPRWKSGVPASLAYINLNDTQDSPKLRPYPNWQAHKINNNDSLEIVSPFRIRADKCGRLWVLDTGVANLLEDDLVRALTPPRLLIYDLHNDGLLRTYEIPASQRNSESFFANVVVEDHDCENSFAYLADLGRPSLVVYSWKDQNSWLVKHNFFHFDPLAGPMNVSGVDFVWSDGIFGLALSEADAEGFSTLYFHPMISYNEYSVSTKVLRNPDLVGKSFHEFKLLGSRGPRSQSGASFLHKKTNVLFYALVNLNAVACWRTTNPQYTMISQGRIFMSNETMVFPNDIKVDNNDNLWVLSDRLPKFMYQTLDYNDVNFRILTAKVSDAIRGTACDSKLVISPTIVDKIMPAIIDNNITYPTTRKSKANNIAIPTIAIIVATLISAILN